MFQSLILMWCAVVICSRLRGSCVYADTGSNVSDVQFVYTNTKSVCHRRYFMWLIQSIKSRHSSFSLIWWDVRKVRCKEDRRLNARYNWETWFVASSQTLSFLSPPAVKSFIAFRWDPPSPPPPPVHPHTHFTPSSSTLAIDSFLINYLFHQLNYLTQFSADLAPSLFLCTHCSVNEGKNLED